MHYNGRKLPVYGDGKNVRDWLYVEDHAKGIDMVQEQGRLFETLQHRRTQRETEHRDHPYHSRYVTARCFRTKTREKHIVNEELITYVEDRKGHDRRYAIAPDKIKAEIGWYPETMFAEGIKKTIKWYFEHEDWMDKCDKR